MCQLHIPCGCINLCLRARHSYSSPSPSSSSPPPLSHSQTTTSDEEEPEPRCPVPTALFITIPAQCAHLRDFRDVLMRDTLALQRLCEPSAISTLSEGSLASSIRQARDIERDMQWVTEELDRAMRDAWDLLLKLDDESWAWVTRGWDRQDEENGGEGEESARDSDIMEGGGAPWQAIERDVFGVGYESEILDRWGVLMERIERDRGGRGCRVHCAERQRQEQEQEQEQEEQTQGGSEEGSTCSGFFS
ncbi:hypothetical protein F5Y17DRAFT_249651 [Xylariaceae sp. FL0594]|nr:hypothetical protein F5Y17DRAFT_249651 [Xylariaceae sp. FL0594]